MPSSSPTRVLLATHSSGLGNALRKTLADGAFRLSSVSAPDARKLADALRAQLASESPDVILLEVEDDTDGLAELRFQQRDLPVIAVLSDSRSDLAFLAAQLGAEDLILMSSSASEICDQVAHVIARRSGPLKPLRPYKLPQSVDEPVLAAPDQFPDPTPHPTGPGSGSNGHSGPQTGQPHPDLPLPVRSLPVQPERFPALFGSHPRMAEIRQTIAKVATTSATVLIRGESGVGKEVVARMIYKSSQRSTRPFVKVNCAAIPHDLLESELFGYEAGAFTGAVRSKPGRFELADTGTLFLDEIGEMHPLLQAKLLQVLQDGEFSRLGAKRDVSVDVRVLCATNQLLEQRVAEGLFREDLFYRINVVTVHIPPLRERRDEIPVLAQFFLERYAALYGRELVPFSAEAAQAMRAYGWPGNIRELENLCKRYVIVGGESQILRELSCSPSKGNALPAPEPRLEEISAPEGAPGLLEIGRRAGWAAERAAIQRTLIETRWNRREASRRLQISYKSLLTKIRQIEQEQIPV